MSSTRTNTRGIASFLYKKRNVLLTPNSQVPFHNFIVRGKSIGGALPIRPSQDKGSSGLPNLARWFLQVNTILRKLPSCKNRECTHTRGKSPWSAQNGDREESPVQAGALAQNLCDEPANLPLSQTSPACSACHWLNLNSSSTKKRVM